MWLKLKKKLKRNPREILSEMQETWPVIWLEIASSRIWLVPFKMLKETNQILADIILNQSISKIRQTFETNSYFIIKRREEEINNSQQIEFEPSTLGSNSFDPSINHPIQMWTWRFKIIFSYLIEKPFRQAI